MEGSQWRRDVRGVLRTRKITRESKQDWRGEIWKRVDKKGRAKRKEKRGEGVKKGKKEKKGDEVKREAVREKGWRVGERQRE